MANEFKVWRQSFDLTQEQAAKVLGLTKRAIAAYEAQEYDPSETTLKLMSAISLTGAAFQPWDAEGEYRIAWNRAMLEASDERLRGEVARAKDTE